MNAAWALTGFAILAIALPVSRFALCRCSAAVRHLFLATAFGAVLFAPFAAVMLPRLEPVRRLQSSIVISVSPDEVAPSAGNASSRSMDPRPVVNWLWFGGAVVLLGRMAFAMDFRRRNAAPASRDVAELGQGIASRLGIVRTVRFEQSAAAMVAETRGALRPVVTLPVAAEEWPAERLRLVLTHELIHVARHDWPATVLAEAVTALHWFNPLAWIALGDLRREREIACDDAVISQGVDGCDYAGHLLEIVSGLKNRSCAPSVAMAHASHLETRIHSILKPDSPRGGTTMKSRLGAAAFAACLLISIAAVQAPAQSAAALSGTVIDATSGRIPEASVIVRNTANKKVEIMRSDATGQFSFSSLPAGTYNLEVAKAGFQLFKQEKLVLAPGSAQNVTVVLNIGRISETINVMGERPKAQPQAADASRPPQRIRIGGGIQHAKMVKQVRPEYPPHLKTAGIEGTVLLEAIIGRDGTIQNVQVQNSLVHADLIQAATQAVQQWQWEPTYLNGQPVEVVTAITVNFTLSK